MDSKHLMNVVLVRIKEWTLDGDVLHNDGIAIPVAAPFAVSLSQGHGRASRGAEMVTPTREVEELQPHEPAALQLDGLLQLGRLLLLFELPPHKRLVVSHVSVHHPRS